MSEVSEHDKLIYQINDELQAAKRIVKERTMVQVDQSDLVKIHAALTVAVDGGDIILAVDALDTINNIMQEEENGSEDTAEVSDSGDSRDESETDAVDPVAV